MFRNETASRRVLLHARDGLQPRLVVRGPHVHARQVGRGALDAVRHGADERPTAVVLFDHQRSAAVALHGHNKHVSLNNTFGSFEEDGGHISDGLSGRRSVRNRVEVIEARPTDLESIIDTMHNPQLVEDEKDI